MTHRHLRTHRRENLKSYIRIHHHHHLAVKELANLLACSDLNRPKVSLKVVLSPLIHAVLIFNSLGSPSLCILSTRWTQLLSQACLKMSRIGYVFSYFSRYVFCFSYGPCRLEADQKLTICTLCIIRTSLHKNKVTIFMITLIFLLVPASWSALGPTQPLIQWVPGVLSPGVKRGRGVTLTTHPHLVPRLRMSRSYTSSPPMCLHGV
jgi:hypothetical protein